MEKENQETLPHYKGRRFANITTLGDYLTANPSWRLVTFVIDRGGVVNALLERIEIEEENS